MSQVEDASAQQSQYLTPIKYGLNYVHTLHLNQARTRITTHAATPGQTAASLRQDPTRYMPWPPGTSSQYQNKSHTIPTQPIQCTPYCPSPLPTLPEYQWAGRQPIVSLGLCADNSAIPIWP